MTNEDMRKLNDLYKLNFDVAWGIEGKFDQIERLAMLATIIDYNTINSRLIYDKCDKLQSNQCNLANLVSVRHSYQENNQ